MATEENIVSRFEKDIRDRIQAKFSFENFKIEIQPKSSYSEEKDVVISFSYQRMKRSDFSYMDVSKFSKTAVDEYISRYVSGCILKGSFTYSGYYETDAVQFQDGGGVSIFGSDLHLESIKLLLGIDSLKNASEEKTEVAFENQWMEKENDEWVDPSDEEYEEWENENCFEIRFLKSIIDIVQNEIYTYLKALSAADPDAYRRLGVEAEYSF